MESASCATDRRWLLRGSAVLVALLVLIGAGVVRTADEDWRGPAERDWPVPGGQWGQMRYSALRTINRSNVKSLGGAWHVHLDGEHVQATPVVKGGLMFLPTGAQNLYALDARSGAIVWRYDSGGRGAGGRNWGVALGGGLVFLPQSDTRIVALDQRTGRVVWVHRLADDATRDSVPASLDSAPIYANGLVISGLQSGDAGVRGRVIALNATTGEEVWRFYTVPGPGEFGHETWPSDNEAWRRGGAAVWHTPAVDPDLGMVYVNTGNPWQSWVGENRTGENLFSSSVVAIDLRTGKYRWHFQLVHHDIWDWDAPNPIVLFEAIVNGRARKGLAEVRTDGFVFLLDRTTGHPLYEIQERPVRQEARQRTWATQPFPVGAAQLVPNCVQPGMVPTGFLRGCEFDPVWSDQPNLTIPGFGPRHAPFSFSPQTGFFYVVSSVLPRWIFRNETTRSGGFRIAPGTTNYGVLTAYNSRTQQIAWQQRLPHQAAFGSGTTVTAGGLVFHGEPDGRVEAYDATKGTRLWEFQTEFGADGPIATYEAGGEQFVALASGGNVYDFSELGDAVWAFKLGGTIPPAAAPQPPPTRAPVPGDRRTTTRIELGGSGEERFVPARAEVKAGVPVTWVNVGKSVHTAAAEHELWTTGALEPGASVTMTFDTSGTYTFICKQHPWIIGELIVTR